MASSSEWFVALRNATVLGPFNEAQVRTNLANGKIPMDASVRQGNSRWHSFAEIEAVFRSLDAKGWFVRRVDGSVDGPFTAKRFRQLRESNSVTNHTLVRRGSNRNWQPLGLLKLKTKQHAGS